MDFISEFLFNHTAASRHFIVISSVLTRYCVPWFLLIHILTSLRFIKFIFWVYWSLHLWRLPTSLRWWALRRYGLSLSIREYFLDCSIFIFSHLCSIWIQNILFNNKGNIYSLLFIHLEIQQFWLLSFQSFK